MKNLRNNWSLESFDGSRIGHPESMNLIPGSKSAKQNGQLYKKIIAIQYKSPSGLIICEFWEFEANQILNQITLCPTILWIWFPAQNLSQNGISNQKRTEQKEYKSPGGAVARGNEQNWFECRYLIDWCRFAQFFLRSVTRLPLRSIFLRRVPLRAIEPLDGCLQISSE